MRLPARNVDIGSLTDAFLVFAVGTVLVIRFQLWVTNYPQLDPGQLHIAHMLWGGLLMMVAIVAMVSFISRSIRTFGAVVGGIGFGFFIDELGKFITKDNDYFFQPTIALIYIIFIIIYLVTRHLQRRQGFSARENLANVLELVKDGAIHGISESSHARALELLKSSDKASPFYTPSRSFLEAYKAEPDPRPRLSVRAVRRMHGLYRKMIENRWFNKAVTAVFIVFAIEYVVQIISIILFTGASLVGLDASKIIDIAFNQSQNLSFVSWATIVSSLVTGAFIIVGVHSLKRSRLEAYQMFDRGLLVSIFITQVFILAESQLAAIIGLGINFLLLASVRYMISEEKTIAAGTAGTQTEK